MSQTNSRHLSGFTIIELMVVIVVIAAASTLFFVQKQNIDTANQDERRKVAINAMYYNLEEVFHPANGFYPSSISADNLKAMDPALFTDSNGITPADAKEFTNLTEEEKANYLAIAGGLPSYEYSYTPTNCDNEGKCKGYTLRVALANEAEYVKKSRHN